MLRNERLVKPADGHDIRGQADPRFHGFGPLSVSLPGFGNTLDSHVIQTTKELDGYKFNLDMNSGNMLGLGA